MMTSSLASYFLFSSDKIFLVEFVAICEMFLCTPPHASSILTIQTVFIIFRIVEIVLTEGRNRQIRKMAEAVGLTVVDLHRTGFAGISLKGLSEGNWAEFSEAEMSIVQEAIKAHKGNAGEKIEVEDDED